MRVAVVTPYAFDAPGGVQDQVRRIVRWLGDAGYDAWSVAPGSGGPEGTRHVGSFRSIRANRSVAPIAIDPRVVRRVAAAVSDADVVHVHEPFMPMVSVGAILARTPPMVATFHADPGTLTRRLYRVAGGLLARMAARVGVFTAVSEVAASALAGRFSGVRVIPNGIDLEDYTGVGDRASARVVFVGRDEPRKGLDVLLQAWPRVRARFPNAELRVVGAARPRGPEGVAFLGRLDDGDKRAELAAAELLVAPNLGGESFGIVVVEGMAAGCAVIASDIAAFRAVAGDAARFTPAGDPPALAETICGLLADSDGIGRLAGLGRRRAASFGREAVLTAYMAAYRDAVSAGGVSTAGR
jgi:phosphatidylinositol alpha-mannosyltransferase